MRCILALLFVLAGPMVRPLFGNELVDAIAPPRAAPSGMTYREAREKALRERKDLILWVGGYSKPGCEPADAVNCHCTCDPFGTCEPCVLVGCYCHEDGALYSLGYTYPGYSGDVQEQRARVRASFRPRVTTARPVVTMRPSSGSSCGPGG